MKGPPIYSGDFSFILSRKFPGLGTHFLKANGDTDITQYTPVGTIVNSSIPYINSSGALSSAGTNLYVQGGVNTIQSALDSIQSGVGYSIQLSASSFTESLTLSKQNIMNQVEPNY